MRMRILSLIIIYSTVLSSAGCMGTANLNMNYQQRQDYQNLFSTISLLKINLSKFADKREGNKEGIWIGHRKTAFNQSMGEVYSDRPVFDIVREAVQLKLNKAGHVIVTEGQDITMEGTISKFIVYTDATLLYWDIIGETSFSLKIIKNDGSKSATFGPYSGKLVNRTFVWPDSSLMQKVLLNSLDNAMKELCSDKQIIDFLKNK